MVTLALCLPLLIGLLAVLLLQREKRSLEMKRLDLDAAKSKLKRARTEKGKSDVSY